jgi:hypothetical protein
MGFVGLKMVADSAYRVNVGVHLDLSGQIGQRNPDRQVPPPRGERLVGMSASASVEWLGIGQGHDPPGMGQLAPGPASRPA